MQEAELVYIADTDGIDRIYPPKAQRSKILELLHQGGKHLDVVMTRCKIHYQWPRMKQNIKYNVSSCKTCFACKPSKSEAEHRGLSIPLEDLSPMDLISTDLMEIKDPKGKKSHFIIIVDRFSGFVSAYKLIGTKTKHIVALL